MTQQVFGVVRPNHFEEEPSKAAIHLTIPSQEVMDLLEKDHDRRRFGGLSFKEFIRPFQLQSPHNDLVLTASNFILESDSQMNRSRFQVVETNDSSILFMFGEQARTFTYQLRLLDGGVNLQGQDTDWVTRMEDFYRRFSGTVVATYGLSLSLEFDREVHDVVWLNFDIQRSSEMDTLASAIIQAFVIDKRRKTYTVGQRGGSP